MGRFTAYALNNAATMTGSISEPEKPSLNSAILRTFSRVVFMFRFLK